MQNETEWGMSRRSLLLGAAMAGAAQAFGSATMRAESTRNITPAPPAGPLKVSIFSKHLQFMPIGEAAIAAKDMGFDAIDMTVRAEGHVLPENVTTDLPKAVAAVRKAGLEVSMVSTEITPATMPMAKKILEAAAGEGIHHYRWGGLKYETNKPIVAQLDAMRPGVRALADLSQKTGVAAMYHTHSGPEAIGATIWDLWEMFRGLDPKWFGFNYDIGHATVEGGYGGWICTSKLSADWMRGIALKDFLWARNEKGSTHADPYDKSLGTAGAFVPHWCPINEGMVHFDQFLSIVKAQNFNGPLQLHFEYPLGGAENGKTTLALPREQVLATMKKDLQAVRAHLAKQGLA